MARALATLFVALIASESRAEPLESIPAFPVEPRESLGFMKLNPSRQDGVVRHVELLASLDRSLSENTSLRLRELDTQALGTCATEIVCSSQVLISGTRTSTTPRFLLQLSVITREGRSDRISARLVSTKIAAELGAARGTRSVLEVEVEAFERAVVATTEWAEVADAEQLDDFVDQLVRRDLRPAFEAAGAWRTLGRARIEGLPAGFRVRVDGRVVVSTSLETGFELTDLAVGQRALRFEHDEYDPVELPVEIRWGEVQTVSPVLGPRRTTEVKVARAGVLIVGASAAFVGATLAVTAAALASERSSVGCVTAEGSDTPGCGGWYGAVPMAPVGMGVLVAGSAMIAGGGLADDESEILWVSLAGAGAGLVAFFLSWGLAP